MKVLWNKTQTANLQHENFFSWFLVRRLRKVEYFYNIISVDVVGFDRSTTYLILCTSYLLVLIER